MLSRKNRDAIGSYKPKDRKLILQLLNVGQALVRKVMGGILPPITELFNQFMKLYA
jgi:hypothetical protein